MVQELKMQQLFTLEEAAKWCGLNPRAMYMRYRRGQIRPVPMLSHRLYFSQEEIEKFRSNYLPFIMS